jgi:Fic family protein
VPVTFSSTEWRSSTVEVLATVPPEIADLAFAIPSAVTSVASEAEARMMYLEAALADRNPAVLTGIEGYLLRAESISSSRIEGLDVSAKNLAEAAFSPAAGKLHAKEVVANVAAMQAAIDLGINRDPLTVDDLLDLHAVLMHDAPGIKEGTLRETQNWIGASNNPADAVYVPPPASEVRRLLDDLVTFANRTDMSVAVQAALAHAQFEAIHPFVDGNGRVGRCLIGAITRKRLGTRVFPPVSAQLWRDRSGYITDIDRYITASDPWPWVKRLAYAMTNACTSALDTIRSIDDLQQQWRRRLGERHQDSAVLRILAELPANTVINTAVAARLLGVTDDTARAVLDQLEAAGITHQVSLGRRNRVWRVPEIHELLDLA